MRSYASNLVNIAKLFLFKAKFLKLFSIKLKFMIKMSNKVLLPKFLAIWKINIKLIVRSGNNNFFRFQIAEYHLTKLINIL